MKIVISGTVGVGKSTICDILNEHFKKNNKKTILYKELDSNNPYLDFYYKSRKDWSFIIQIDFLNQRFHKVFQDWKEKKHEISIFDRHFLDDYVFASSKIIQNDMSKENIETYFRLNNYLTKILKKNLKVDYLFLLKTDFDEIISRIKKRDRSIEKNKKLNNYWEEIYFQYYKNEKIQEYFKSNVKNFFIIDASKKQEEIANEIIKKLNI